MSRKVSWFATVLVAAATVWAAEDEESVRTELHSNGRVALKSVEVRRGAVRVRTVTAWHDNGQLKSEENYRNGVRTDLEWKEYHTNGQVSSVSQHDEDGRLNGWVRTYYENGQVWTEEEYSHGKSVSPRTCYHPNGRLHQVWTLSDGVETNTEWHASGKMKIHEVYMRDVNKGGTPIGVHKSWDTNGFLICAGLYRDGKPWHGTFWYRTNAGDWLETFTNGVEATGLPEQQIQSVDDAIRYSFNKSYRRKASDYLVKRFREKGRLAQGIHDFWEKKPDAYQFDWRNWHGFINYTNEETVVHGAH